MKRPWQIWTLFALCLAVVLPAMGWLSVKTVQLDQQRAQSHLDTEIARRETQLQERVNSALWRLDSWLTPVIAKEVARPYFVYQPFYNSQESTVAGGKSQENNQIPSPLLTQSRNEFVKLHFQIEQNNFFVCPSCPDEDQVQEAIDSGLAKERLLKSCEVLSEVTQFCDFDQINLICAPETLNSMMPEPGDRSIGLNYSGNPLLQGNALNVYELLQQQGRWTRPGCSKR